MKIPKVIIGLVCGGALLLAASPAWAGLKLSDTLLILDRNGGEIVNFSVTEPEPLNDLHTFDSGLGDPNQVGHITVLLEPNAPAPSAANGEGTDPSYVAAYWSDVVGVANTRTAANPRSAIGFISDPLTLAEVQADFFDQLNRTFIDRFVFENNAGSTSVDISSYLNPNGPAGGGRGTYTSDADVPDGGLTLAFLGSALVGVEGLRRRLRK
jgi:hypothetical protein